MDVKVHLFAVETTTGLWSCWYKATLYSLINDVSPQERNDTQHLHEAKEMGRDASISAGLVVSRHRATAVSMTSALNSSTRFVGDIHEKVFDVRFVRWRM